MLTMNVIFHLASAVFAGVFAWYLLKYQKALRLAAFFVKSACQGIEPQVVQIIDRKKLIEFLGDFLNVKLVGTQHWQQAGLGRVEPGVFLHLHLNHGIQLLRCSNAANSTSDAKIFKLEVFLRDFTQPLDRNLFSRLQNSLGQAVTVEAASMQAYKG